MLLLQKALLRSTTAAATGAAGGRRSYCGPMPLLLQGGGGVLEFPWLYYCMRKEVLPRPYCDAAAGGRWCRGFVVLLLYCRRDEAWQRLQGRSKRFQVELHSDV